MASRKSKLMLGLHLEEGAVRAVQVRLAGRVPMLERTATIELPEADAAMAGARLAQALRQRGYSARHVALCLPVGSGFVRSEGWAADRREPAPPPAAEPYISAQVVVPLRQYDIRLTASAQQATAQRAVALAEAAGLRPVSLDVAQVCLATALGLLSGGEDEEVRAGVVAEPHDLFCAVAAGPALMVSRVIRMNGSVGSLRRTEAAAEAISQVYRASLLRDPQAQPAELRLIAAGQGGVAQRVSTMLALPVSATQPGAALGLQCDAWPRDAEAYSAAIGAALIGMELGRHDLALLDALPDPPQTPPRVLVRRAVLIAVGAVLIAVALMVAEGIRKHRELNDLLKRYSEVRHELLAQQAQRRTWNLLRPWLAADELGQRPPSAAVVQTLNDLFPPADEAYVTALVIEGGDPGRFVRITIDGRAKNSAALYDYIARLNRSNQFQQVSMGPVDDDPLDAAYPKKYSISMALRG